MRHVLGGVQEVLESPQTERNQHHPTREEWQGAVGGNIGFVRAPLVLGHSGPCQLFVWLFLGLVSPSAVLSAVGGDLCLVSFWVVLFSRLPLFLVAMLSLLLLFVTRMTDFLQSHNSRSENQSLPKK